MRSLQVEQDCGDFYSKSWRNSLGVIPTVRQYLREMAWTSVANFQRDFDQATRCFSNQLLS